MIKRLIRSLISLTAFILATIALIFGLVGKKQAMDYYKEQQWTEVEVTITTISKGASYGKFSYNGNGYDAVYYDFGMSKKNEVKNLYFKAADIGKNLLYEVTDKPYKPNFAPSVALLTVSIMGILSSGALIYLDIASLAYKEKARKINKMLGSKEKTCKKKIFKN